MERPLAEPPENGLGLYLNPQPAQRGIDPDATKTRTTTSWITEAWRLILRDALGHESAAEPSSASVQT
jgi:hypothetical protein